ncbi:hypothetical protein VitviT2T_011722 [Vitis vinifera]|uniref:RING-type domain-containing protein n=2 Tax=Vitis vinifera TaxID=29760 RepID=A0ABY9CE43_VITVI|eukprot:XP_002264526.1 PREDICTED: uncharacterized protein LOC100247198 [Vitis vinifera]
MEEEQPAPASSAPASTTPFPSSIHNAHFSSAAASSSRASEADADANEQENLMQRHHSPELQRQQISVTYRGDAGVDDEDGSATIRNDTWSCIIVVLTFWFFVSMTLILGVYGSVNMRLGPNCSILLHPNPLFVQYLKVEELDEPTPGPMLYGFYKVPPLEVITTWDQKLKAYTAPYSHREWVYYLNKGSQVNITYSVSSLSSSSLILVIAQGNEGLSQWLEDPTYPNITLSWQLIHGNGTVQQNIYTSSSYYVAVGNTNLEEVEVQLNLTVKALQYNTTGAYSKCNLTQGQCSLKLFFPKANAAVITSPGPEQGIPSDEWYVKLSYGPRWMTYIVGVGGMTVLMLLVFNFLNKFQFNRQLRIGVPLGGTQPETSPLLPDKDDDLSSWDSSYDSASHDEEDAQDKLGVGGLDGKPKKDGENNSNPKRLCTICFDAPRDCFFLPCGHCVACFTCGTRILEEDGTCPICSRNMKKVRKIFTV